MRYRVRCRCAIDELLSALMESAVEAAAEGNGEIPDELQQALFDYCEAFGQKVDNIAWYIRSHEFEAKNAKAEIERLEQRKASAEHRVTRLKALLKFFMESRKVRHKGL
jgi:cob(I)alamin adenosyltransferase